MGHKECSLQQVFTVSAFSTLPQAPHTNPPNFEAYVIAGHFQVQYFPNVSGALQFAIAADCSSQVRAQNSPRRITILRYGSHHNVLKTQIKYSLGLAGSRVEFNFENLSSYYTFY